MAIAAALGVGVRNTVLAMFVVWWPKYARLARGLVLGQRSLDYVEAARGLGLAGRAPCSATSSPTPWGRSSCSWRWTSATP